MHADDFEPLDGVFAVPPPKNAVRYNMAKLHEYCKEHNKKPKELTEVEKKLFIINKHEK